MSATKCPYCEAPLTPAELQERRCTACMRELPSQIQTEPSPWASGGAVPTPERQDWRGLDEDTPRRRPTGEWAGVRAGLGLLIVSLIILLVCQFLNVIPQMIAAERQLQLAASCMQLIVGLAALTGIIIYLIGMIRAVLAPPQSGLRGLGLSALICWLVGLALYIGSVVLLFVSVMGQAMRGPMRGGPGMLPVGMAEVVAFAVPLLASLVLLFISWVLFCIYLRGVARYFGANSLGDAFIAYLITSLVLVVAFIGGAAMLPLLVPRGADAMSAVLVGVCVTIVSALGMTIWWITLLTRLRNLLEGRGY